MNGIFACNFTYLEKKSSSLITLKKKHQKFTLKFNLNYLGKGVAKTRVYFCNFINFLYNFYAMVVLSPLKAQKMCIIVYMNIYCCNASSVYFNINILKKFLAI